jgi:hypothetical protein
VVPSESIDRLVWMALTDSAFRERLLSGHRNELVDGLELKRAEKSAVMAVKADSLERFAAALCRAW